MRDGRNPCNMPDDPTPIDATAQDMNAQTGLERQREAGWFVPPLAFVFAAVAGFSLLVVLLVLLVIRLTYGTGEVRGPQWFAGGGWALLMTLALIWAVVSLGLAARSFRQLQAFAGYRYLAIGLCCGLTAASIDALMIARTLSDEPIVMDFSNTGTGSKRSPAPLAPAAVSGDATEGKKLFAMSCITCHGPTGDGLNNLAPSLRKSDFVRSAEVASVLRVIQQGRAIADPANKSGKVMPARGGNPFLTDTQASHLAVFVKSLPESGVAAPAPSSETPVVQLSRWVVPPAALPPPGTILLKPGKDLIDESAWQQRSSERRDRIVRNLGLAALSIHGLYLCGVFLFSSHLLFGWLLGIRVRDGQARFSLSAWSWLVAIGIWVILLILFGLA